ncbi:MAG: hypothetical protein J6J44_05395 [Lachnospiraceae bacterium]|nr:hypothetical protein [Lachnospiraceae bacterium]
MEKLVLTLKVEADFSIFLFLMCCHRVFFSASVARPPALCDTFCYCENTVAKSHLKTIGFGAIAA